jgi:hypothetical protein
VGCPAALRTPGGDGVKSDGEEQTIIRFGEEIAKSVFAGAIAERRFIL